MLAFVRRFRAGIRVELHRRADRHRVLVYAHRVELEREGLPPEQVDRHGREALAWADFLDGLAVGIDPHRGRADP